MADKKDLGVLSTDANVTGTAHVEVHVDQLQGPPISRYLFGMFTEHIGRNVYGGAWAETIENPWFAGIDRWPNPHVIRERLHAVEEVFCMPGLSGAPENGVAPYWVPIGEVNCSLEAGCRGAAQRISTTTPGQGLRTPVFLPLDHYRRYRLTIRGKATRHTTITVRILTDDGTDFSQVDILLRQGSWRTVHKILWVGPPLSIPQGIPLVIELRCGQHGTVWLDHCSLMPANAIGGWDPDVVALMKKAHLPLLRFPGGNFASGYHWRDGVGPLDSRPIRPNLAWPELEWNDVGTDDWLRLCEQVGCDALICVNTGDGMPEEAAQWVEYCNGDLDTPMGTLRTANGHPEPYGVKLWEIGNECDSHRQNSHAAAADYAECYLAFREAMLASDPSIQLIVSGDDACWNQTLAEAAGSAIRSVSVPVLVGNHIPQEANQDDVFLEYIGYSWAYTDLLAELADPMKNAGLPPKLAITELRLFTHKPNLPHVDNLGDALYYSGIVNTAIRSQGLVELITHSALINHRGGLAKDHGVVYPHPLWLAFHLYSTQPGIQPVHVEIEGPTFNSSGQWLKKVEGVPILDAVALLSEDQEYLIIFVTNRHPEESLDVILTVDGFPAHLGVGVELHGDSFLSTNRWDATDTVRISTKRMRVSNDRVWWRCPAHSLIRLTFRRRDRNVVER